MFLGIFSAHHQLADVRFERVVSFFDTLFFCKSYGRFWDGPIFTGVRFCLYY